MPSRKLRAFSLVELVIVVVIIAIISAIAIPRMSQGSTTASEASLRSNLGLMRRAIDSYSNEHLGAFPTLAAMQAAPNALTGYTDEAGNVSAVKTTTFIYGPYLQRIPALPVGLDKGNSGIVGSYTVGNGWVYDQNDGSIESNTLGTERDTAGKNFRSY